MTSIPSRHVLHIVEATATGTLSMVSLLATIQAEDGHNVEVIYSRRPETPTDLSRFFGPGVKLTQKQMTSAYEQITAAVFIRQLVKHKPPHAIFLHSSFAGFIARLALVGTANATKVFYIPHGISFLRQDVGTWKRNLFIAFERIASIRSCTYLACSRSEMAAIQSSIPFRPCLLIENAVALPPPHLIPPRNNERYKIVTVGQIRAQKDPQRFAEIMQIIQQQEAPIDFVWIGDGAADDRATLERHGAVVTGWLTKKRVFEILTESDLYLSTARWEGLPVSIIEAQLCGLPVVASACAGNVDCIENGHTGWLYDQPKEAAALILSVLADRTIREEIVEHARNTAQTRFGIERYRTETTHLLEQRI